MSFSTTLPTSAAVPASINGYSFEQAPDLTQLAVREELSKSALAAFVRIANSWELTESQSRALLGGIASSTFHAWRSEPEKQKLGQDTLIRISLLIGIYKALHSYFGEPWADRWVTSENRGPLFMNGTPVDYMIRQGQPGMSQVRRMLDSWQSGR